MNKNFEELLIKIEERVHEKLPEDVTLSPVNQKETRKLNRFLTKVLDEMLEGK